MFVSTTETIQSPVQTMKRTNATRCPDCGHLVKKRDWKRHKAVCHVTHPYEPEPRAPRPVIEPPPPTNDPQLAQRKAEIDKQARPTPDLVSGGSKKAQISAVVAFTQRHEVYIPQREIENWRKVVPGVYTHKALHLGPMLDGITDGVVAHMVDQHDKVHHVHLDNMNVYFDLHDLLPDNEKPESWHQKKALRADKAHAKRANIEALADKILEELL